MPEDMPEDMPDRMPEDMLDKMPEDMSDRMPEDLPVRKCINVMVGITRSKVCFFWKSDVAMEHYYVLTFCLPERTSQLFAAVPSCPYLPSNMYPQC